MRLYRIGILLAALSFGCTPPAPEVQPTTLAPLSSPHPGCVAFYRDCDDFSDFAPGRPLRGYKVYRNTSDDACRRELFGFAPRASSDGHSGFAAR